MALHLLGVFCLLLHTSVGIAAKSLVDLETASTLLIPCYTRVALHCNISSQAELSVNKLAWIDVASQTELCVVNMNNLSSSGNHSMKCEYIPQKRLTLTFRHVHPEHQRTYKCSLKSNRGIKQATTKVKLQDCYRNKYLNLSASWATCHFSGVYPEGEVHWFHGDRNVTEHSDRHTTRRNHDGTFNVSSSLHTEHSSSECSLWIPSSKAYLVRQPITKLNSLSYRSDSRAVAAHTFSLGFGLMLTRLLVP
nr:uncharacterized protein LOC111847816 [Paramormyrops kingsleyae]XP_023675137.1 uncharacterized protein LOC111847816 [Paramormyrops kingsleyae]